MKKNRYVALLATVIAITLLFSTDHAFAGTTLDEANHVVDIANAAANAAAVAATTAQRAMADSLAATVKSSSAKISGDKVSADAALQAAQIASTSASQASSQNDLVQNQINSATQLLLAVRIKVSADVTAATSAEEKNSAQAEGDALNAATDALRYAVDALNAARTAATTAIAAAKVATASANDAEAAAITKNGIQKVVINGGGGVAKLLPPKTKLVTITCIKGKITERISVVKPTCPKGYRKK